MTLDECEAIFDNITRGESESSVCAAYRELLTQYPLINVEKEMDTYWRGRKCDSRDGYKNVSAVIYPPPEKTTAQRLNDPGSPVLYTSLQPETVFPELHVNAGDYVHLIGVRPDASSEIRSVTIGELYHVYKTGYMRLSGLDEDGALLKFLRSYDEKDATRIVFVDAFLSKILADPHAEVRDYLSTRCLAREVLRKVPEVDGFFTLASK